MPLGNYWTIWKVKGGAGLGFARPDNGVGCQVVAILGQSFGF